MTEALNPTKQGAIARPLSWLALGWRDCKRSGSESFVYGAIVAIGSLLFVATLVLSEQFAFLLPSLAGFLVVGPFLAVALYERSRRLEARDDQSTWHGLQSLTTRSGGQIAFAGALLLLLFVLWIRAAFLLYALVYGLLPFPGVEALIENVVTTPRGWLLLSMGSAVGGLFAGFSFAISAFSFPMIVDRHCDALTAMGLSFAASWHNLRLAIVWGAIVVAGFVLSIATALLGLALIFPVLGHASWHAYQDVMKSQRLDSAS